MLPAEQITERMAKLEPSSNAFGSKGRQNGCLLINDSYNSDLGSLDIALDFLYRRSQSKGSEADAYPFGYIGDGTEYADSLPSGGTVESKQPGNRAHNRCGK